MRAGVVAIVVSLVALGACDEERERVGESPREPAVRTITDPPGPYVSVAVDNHFHDIHPIDHKTIDSDTAFIVRNEGRNLHNVSIQGTEVNRDIAPGEEFALRPVGRLGPPGTYTIICKYHASSGMTGEITITR